MIFDFTKFGWPAMIELIDFKKLDQENDKQKAKETQIIEPVNDDICHPNNYIDRKK